MAKERGRPTFVRRNEKDLIAVATDALVSGFPNPERIGCPEARILDAVAGRRLTFSEINDVVDHIATCSPCFDIYTGYRKEYCARHNWKRSIAVVALLAALAATWYLGRQVLPQVANRPPQIAEVAPMTAVLDFHDRTAERSDQVQPSGPIAIPHLRRSLLSLQIRLPIGTEDGQYSIEFRRTAGQTVIQTTGTAKWDGTTETLSIRIDLRTVEPGQYTLALRKGAASWRQYSVFVD
ncbi:MAG TPA: hypothetical protein VK752_31160 [Bryobacteraceae bacterium]|nr:hypothetical protein [Bryobacteraceae bacterium]